MNLRKKNQRDRRKTPQRSGDVFYRDIMITYRQHRGFWRDRDRNYVGIVIVCSRLLCYASVCGFYLDLGWNYSCGGL